MLDAATVNENIEVSCAIGLPVEAEVDETKVQNIIEDIKRPFLNQKT